MEWRLNLAKVALQVSGNIYNVDKDEIVKNVVTDSRNITEGCVFVALKGEKTDGHYYVKKALEDGAVCAIVSDEKLIDENLAIIVVKDTFLALRQIAKLYRKEFDIPCVAVTGSVGKTSTKDMIHSVLSEEYDVHKTEKNYNNEIGLPLTVFGMKSENDIMVLEMGMSGFGEISNLTDIALPDTAVITNIGVSHIENLGSQENILKAKLEITEGLSLDGTLILNGDDPYLRKLEGTLPYEMLYYGIENKNCDLTAENIKKYSEGTDFTVRIEGTEYNFSINVPGEHHVYNALCAILVGMRYNVPVKKIISGVAKFIPSGMRQNIIKLNDLTVIKDCYNASTQSMKSGLDVLDAVLSDENDEGAEGVAVLGDMLELGEISQTEHEKVGKMIVKHNVKRLITVGKMAEHIAKSAIEEGFSCSSTFVFYDNESVINNIYNILKPKDVVLFKGSRGMKLEEIADFLIKNNSTKE